MKVVIDTSTLISLAKIDFLDILAKLKKQMVVPKAVYDEAVVEGEVRAFPDALAIKSLIKERNAEVIVVKRTYIEMIRRKMGKTLAKGDEAVLACALQEKANEVITNDDGLGRLAMILKFRVSASTDLLFSGLKNGVSSINDYDNFLRSLVIENRIASAVAELYIMEGKKICQR